MILCKRRSQAFPVYPPATRRRSQNGGRFPAKSLTVSPLNGKCPCTPWSFVSPARAVTGWCTEGPRLAWLLALDLPFAERLVPFLFPCLLTRFASLPFLSCSSHFHLVFQQNKPLPPAARSFQSLFHLPPHFQSVCSSLICEAFIVVITITTSVTFSSSSLFFLYSRPSNLDLPLFDRLTAVLPRPRTRLIPRTPFITVNS